MKREGPATSWLIVCAVALALAVSLFASTVRARDAPLVLLVLEGTPGAMHRRLEAELAQLGFRVATDRGAGSLEGRARALRADAAVRVPRSHRAVEVWVTDPDRLRTARRSVVVPGDGQGEAILAVRAVELLRAAFLEIDVAMPEPPPPIAGGSPSTSASASASVSASPSASPSGSAPAGPASGTPIAAPQTSASAIPPPPPAPEPERRAPPTLFASAGAFLSASPGGVPADVHLGLGLGRRFGERLRVDAWLTTPGQTARVEAPGGTSSVRSTLFGMDASWTWPRGDATLLGGLGLGAVWVHAEGRADAGFDARSTDAWLAWPYARAGGTFALSQRLRIALDLRAGATLPRAVIRFADRDVATLGRPLVVPGLGLEVALD